VIPLGTTRHPSVAAAHAHALATLEQLAALHGHVTVDVRPVEGGADLVLEGLRPAKGAQLALDGRAAA